MAEGAPTRVIITGGTTEAPPAGPFNTPALYPNIVSLSHLVSRPDLVRIDEEGTPSEIAIVMVDGKVFEDWKTVWIQWSWGAQFSQFKFTCAEREPYPLAGMVLQFAPGSEVQVFLGGIQVITGMIITRQIAYDAGNHIVQFQGVSASWAAGRSSIDHPTGDFNNKSFTQIADELLKPTGVKYDTIGEIDQTPFDRASPSPGETIGQMLERIARDRKIIISNLPNGKYLFVGENAFPAAQAELVEGINIKKMQCVISVELARTEFIQRGQTRGNDEQHGPKASEQEARLSGTFPGSYSILLGTMEHPVWSKAELDKRVANEKMWNEDLTKIDATITVYGWFRPLPTAIASWAVYQQLGPVFGHTLWQAGDDVIVRSPMAMLIDQHMKIRTVTWMQDTENGTQTILDCCLPSGLNGPPVPIPGPSTSSIPSPVTGRAPGPV